jgi:uncharacterized membrane protein
VDASPPPEAAPSDAGGRDIRAVRVRRAFGWYREAMLLWQRAPLTFGLLALVTLASEIVFELVPTFGRVLAQLVTPVIACGLLYGMLAADRGERPRLMHVLAVLGAAPSAIAAVLLSSLAEFAVQVAVAQWLAGYDLIGTSNPTATLAPADALAIYAVGVLISLPLTFVPFSALFDGVTLATAFRDSVVAFARNVRPLFVYGVLSFALLLVGLITNGIALLLVLPWWAGSSYAAWKDIFGLTGPRP